MSTDAFVRFQQSLIDSGLLLPTGVDGLFGHSETYEEIAREIGALVHRLGADQHALFVSFPPVIAREVLRKTGFVESFPNLVGSVVSFKGSDRQHGELLKTITEGGDWTPYMDPTDLALCPAACHALYPACSGRLPEGGKRFEVDAYCFRHEPSSDPARLQAFRMHEFVYLGHPKEAVSHRDRWVERACSALAELGLSVEARVANDPFFGRTGRLLADRQRRDALKIEIVSAMPAYGGTAAVASCNWHGDHFGTRFGIERPDGQPAHSSCVGFGVDRILTALLASHGLDPNSWPDPVRHRLRSPSSVVDGGS